jgi:hypothetical protein
MHSNRRPDPNRSPEALEARLRALPQPRIPAALKARLLATAPPVKPLPRERWAARAVVLAVTSAAGVMIVLNWRPQHEGELLRSPAASEPRRHDIERPSFESTSIASLRTDHRLLDEQNPPAFTWPLDASATLRASISIPADLLE